MENSIIKGREDNETENDFFAMSIFSIITLLFLFYIINETQTKNPTSRLSSETASTSYIISKENIVEDKVMQANIIEVKTDSDELKKLKKEKQDLIEKIKEKGNIAVTLSMQLQQSISYKLPQVEIEKIEQAHNKVLKAFTEHQYELAKINSQIDEVQAQQEQDNLNNEKLQAEIKQQEKLVLDQKLKNDEQAKKTNELFNSSIASLKDEEVKLKTKIAELKNENEKLQTDNIALNKEKERLKEQVILSSKEAQSISMAVVKLKKQTLKSDTNAQESGIIKNAFEPPVEIKPESWSNLTLDN